MKQPKSVSVIANIDIILSAFGLISALITSPELISESIQLLSVSHEIATISSVVFSISLIYFAFNMLKGIERARKALLMTHFLQIIISFFILKNKLMILPSIPLFFVYYYFLNRPNVLLYFDSNRYTESEASQINQHYGIIDKKRVKVSPQRQLIAILGFVFSSIFIMIGQISLSLIGETNAIATILVAIAIGVTGLFISLSLWANDFWKVSGIILIVTSSMTLMSCLSIYIIKDSPDIYPMPSQSVNAISQIDPTASIIVSAILLITGIAFLNNQRKIDMQENQKKSNQTPT